MLDLGGDVLPTTNALAYCGIKALLDRPVRRMAAGKRTFFDRKYLNHGLT